MARPQNALSQSAVTILQKTDSNYFKERTAFLNLFAYMERSLNTQFNVDINKGILESAFNQISNVYTGLKNLSLIEATALLRTLTYFRNSCAHYCFNKKISAYYVNSIFENVYQTYETLYPLSSNDGDTIRKNLNLISYYDFKTIT